MDPPHHTAAASRRASCWLAIGVHIGKLDTYATRSDANRQPADDGHEGHRQPAAAAENRSKSAHEETGGSAGSGPMMS